MPTRVTLRIGLRVEVTDYSDRSRKYPSFGTVTERAFKPPEGLIWKVVHDDGLENWYPDKDVDSLLKIVDAGSEEGEQI